MDRRQHNSDDDDGEFTDRAEDSRYADFSRHERKQIRDIMDRDSKARWLASTVRAWGAWIAAGLVALIAFSDSLRRLLKGWLS